MSVTILLRAASRLRALLTPLLCLLLGGQAGAQTPPPPPALVATHSFFQNYVGTNSVNEGTSPDSLIQGGDGFFYGTTQNAGLSNDGTVFKVRGDGSGFAVVSPLVGVGGQPNSVMQGRDGVLYGTATGYNGGTIFRVNTDGTGETVLHRFSSPPNIEGSSPSGRLVQGADGYLYGATSFGGTGTGGTLFKISPDGLAFIVIHVFTALNGRGDTNGALPSALTLGADGILYGITRTGGPSGDTVFKINTDGSGFTTLYAVTSGSFASVAPQIPDGPLTFGTDGALYGATSGGGAAGNGSLFKINTDGTGFTTLHQFGAISLGPNGYSNTDGGSPLGLTQGGDGYFYGAASNGGANGTGTVFQVSPDGTVFRVLHAFGPMVYSFDPPPNNQGLNRDGTSPLGPLAVGSDGLLYGTAGGGGLNNSGTVFRLVTSHTHVLWTKADGTASLWSVDTSGVYTHAEYGPYPGWAATAVASGGDGLTRLLWSHAADGEIALWAVDGAGLFRHQEYGPYPGWTSDSLAAGADGLPHVLWNYAGASGFGGLSSGTASVWDVDAAGGFGYHDYGPYPGWTATAAAIGGDGLTRLLWNHAPDGQIALWGLTPATGAASVTLYGPFAGWTAFALSAGADSVPHVLWNNADGRASLWTVNADASYLHFEFGPYPGWGARGLATGPDNVSRLLWDEADGTLSLWALDNDTGAFTFQNYGPFAGWTAVAVSAGP